MTNEQNKYDPAIYGELRAEFLKNMDTNTKYFNTNYLDNEKHRQEVLKDIQEGRLIIIKK